MAQQLQVVKNTGKQVAARPTNRISIKEFDEVQEWVADIAAHNRKLDSLARTLSGDFLNDWTLKDYFKKAEDVLWTTDQFAKQRDRVDALLERYSPEDDDPDYNDDGLTRTYVAAQVALLLGAFPAGSPTDPQVYTRLMIEEVLSAEPYKHSLESTVRIIRRTHKFLPTISEVLSVLKAEEKKWCENFLYYHGNPANKVRKQLDALRPRYQALLEAEEKRNAELRARDEERKLAEEKRRAEYASYRAAHPNGPEF